MSLPRLMAVQVSSLILDGLDLKAGWKDVIQYMQRYDSLALMLPLVYV